MDLVLLATAVLTHTALLPCVCRHWLRSEPLPRPAQALQRCGLVGRGKESSPTSCHRPSLRSASPHFKHHRTLARPAGPRTEVTTQQAKAGPSMTTSSGRTSTLATAARLIICTHVRRRRSRMLYCMLPSFRRAPQSPLFLCKIGPGFEGPGFAFFQPLSTGAGRPPKSEVNSDQCGELVPKVCTGSEVRGGWV